MRNKRILLMYISEVSGHKQAALAIEKALLAIEPKTEILHINAFNYTNPILEKVINQAYMGVVKNVPGLWGYLYDNPNVVKRTQNLRNSIHRYNSRKLKDLIGEFKPDGVACTQAFPCGMVADFKKHNNPGMSIIGVLTDYAPHSYWIYNNVDAYIVPCEETGHKFIDSGVPKDRIKPFGIPIDPKFKKDLSRSEGLKKLGLREGLPVILLMGGGQGLGPIKNSVITLEKLSVDLDIAVVTGTNKRLHDYLSRKRGQFSKLKVLESFTDNIDEIMSASTMVVTKPGGLTTAEALSKKLPMVIMNPLPGQEAMNADFLLKKRLAVRANNEKELGVLINELLEHPGKLDFMRSLAKDHAKPDAAFETAQLILRLS